MLVTGQFEYNFHQVFDLHALHHARGCWTVNNLTVNINMNNQFDLRALHHTRCRRATKIKHKTNNFSYDSSAYKTDQFIKQNHTKRCVKITI